MKTFLISFLLTTTVIIYLNLPAVIARPIDIIPRVIFYLAFPISIFVMMLGIMLMSFFGWSSIPVRAGDNLTNEAAVV